jgi:hypothetical protein
MPLYGDVYVATAILVVAGGWYSLSHWDLLRAAVALFVYGDHHVARVPVLIV